MLLMLRVDALGAFIVVVLERRALLGLHALYNVRRQLVLIVRWLW